MSNFLNESETLDSLLAKMKPEDSAEYKRYGHLRREAAFEDRVFIVYQPRGVRSNYSEITDQKEPIVLSTVRVTGLTTDIKNGAQVRLYNEATGSEMTVGYTPKKLFNYPIYISLPADMNLKLGGQRKGDTVNHSFTFVMLIKSRNRSDFYSVTNTYMETPDRFRKLFPATTNKFSF